MEKVVLDTDIIIDHLRLKTKRRSSLLDKLIADESLILLISTVTIGELFIGQSTRDKKHKKDLKHALSFFKTVDLDSKVAETAGKIIRDLKRPIQFNDAVIAATATLSKAPLATKNKKDFAKIPKLQFYKTNAI